MNIEEIRNYCLSKEGVIEKTPFGKFARRFDSILVFYVKDHMFCLINTEQPDWVEVASTPDEIAALEDNYRVATGPFNPAMRNWVHISFNGDIPDNEIYQLIDDAYNHIKAKYTKL